MVLEQPSSSLMAESPWLQFLDTIRGLGSCHVKMGAYGAKIPKGTTLWYWGDGFDSWPASLTNSMTRKEIVAMKEASDAVMYCIKRIVTTKSLNNTK